ncbi:hypothetical protein FRC03_000946 [Tulasnella sp. 419]|nr:hypothetical protein FRC03_000946 [Tulasnella sp. 419]
MKGIITEPSHVNHHDVSARLRITTINVARGSYGDVSKGTLVCLNGSSMEVAIKTFRHRGSTDSSEPAIKLERLRKKLRQEVNIWGRLDHPNVAPLLGFSLPVDTPPSLVSPWYLNGSLTTYLKSTKDVNHLRIVGYSHLVMRTLLIAYFSAL